MIICFKKSRGIESKGLVLSWCSMENNPELKVNTSFLEGWKSLLKIIVICAWKKKSQVIKLERNIENLYKNLKESFK